MKTAVPTVITKEALLRFGKILPKTKAFTPTRNAMAQMYRNMRKTPLGAAAARVIYDNVELMPHSVLTAPIPFPYQTDLINAAYILSTAKNKRAKLRSIVDLFKQQFVLGGKAIKDVSDSNTMRAVGMANSMPL